MSRRTQQERRTETIGKLVDATIASLAERGYAASSTSVICKRAGVSQGGLFNHFGKRVDLIVATTEAICRTHLEQYATVVDAVPPHPAGAPAHSGGELQLARAVIDFVRATTRTPEHSAWHEVMVAARTDEELRDRIAPAVAAFEQALLSTAATVLGVTNPDERFAMAALSIMHMFDSEAVTTAIYPNEAIEAARIEWATELLEAEVRGAKRLTSRANVAI